MNKKKNLRKSSRTKTNWTSTARRPHTEGLQGEWRNTCIVTHRVGKQTLWLHPFCVTTTLHYRYAAATDIKLRRKCSVNVTSFKILEIIENTFMHWFSIYWVWIPVIILYTPYNLALCWWQMLRKSFIIFQVYTVL